jgi:hypothetical protein
LSRALVLLVWLRNVASLGTFWRRGRGSPIALVGKFWILAIVVGAATGWVSAVWHSFTSNPDQLLAVWFRSAVREAARMAPLPALVFLIWTGILAAFDHPFRFNPSEVDFLCAGPFRRRQLVNYKLGAALSGMVFISFLLAAPSGRLLSSFPQMFVGSLLLFIFLHLFAVFVGLLGTVLGFNDPQGWRRFAITIGLALAGLAVFWIRSPANITDPIAIYRQLDQSLAWRVSLSPVCWFLEVILAERLWPDLIGWLALCLFVNVLLFVMVHALDARLHLRAEPEVDRPSGEESVSTDSRPEPWTLPLLPRWRGLGSIAWRQSVIALRSPALLSLAFSMYGLLLFMIFALALSRQSILFLPRFDGALEINRPGAMVCTGLALILCMIITSALSFDFRRDVAQIDVLKAMPVEPIILTAGQLLVPAVLTALMQWMTLAAIAIALRSTHAGFWLAACFVPPVSVIVAALENLPILWFPFHETPGSKPEPFEMLGHIMIHPLLRLVGYSAVVLATLVVAAGAFFLFGQRFSAAIVAAWLTLAAGGFGLVGLVAHVFDQFDVTRDGSG